MSLRKLFGTTTTVLATLVTSAAAQNNTQTNNPATEHPIVVFYVLPFLSLLAAGLVSMGCVALWQEYCGPCCPSRRPESERTGTEPEGGKKVEKSDQNTKLMKNAVDSASDQAIEALEEGRMAEASPTNKRP